MTVQLFPHLTAFDAITPVEKPNYFMPKSTLWISEKTLLREKPLAADIEDFQPRWWPGEDSSTEESGILG